MKKLFTLLVAIMATQLQAQENKNQPQITVAGEGKVKVIPDQVVISATIENKGNEPKNLKQLNDQTMDAVLKVIKKYGIPATDFKTQNVLLQPQYDYDKKKNYYLATQTLEIVLNNLSLYDSVMESLVAQGVNRIDGVNFQSSKLATYQSEARKLAVKEAKAKAEDYVSVLGQKVGKAITISEGNVSQSMPSVRMVRSAAKTMSEDSSFETLAAGEMTVTANVTIQFVLE